MAIKKEALDNFFEEELSPPKKPVYSSYRVFDELPLVENDNAEVSNKKIISTGKQSYNTSHNKPTTKNITISKQLVNKSTEKQITIGEQLENKAITKHITNGTPKRCSGNSLACLSGLPRKIILAIYQNCKISGSNTTGAITLDHLSSIVGCNKNCIKTTINRLRKKDFLNTVEYKTGRGGWVIYRLSERIYLDILKNEGLVLHDSLLNGGINKWETQPITQAITNSFSSSNIYKTTTNISNDMPIEWQNIDIEPLKKIGFSKNHLKQLSLIPILSPKNAQNSIYAFAFDLEENNKAKKINKDPISFFMGILRTTGIYIPPSNYEAPQERLMRIWTEKMKQRDTEPRKEKIEEEAFSLSFNDWFKNFTDEEKMEFLPKNLRVNNIVLDSYLAKEKAINYFRKEVWSDIKKEIEIGGTE